MQNSVMSDIQIVVPWWIEVKSCAEKIMQLHQPLTGLRVAIICKDLYRFDSISTSVCEQAIVLSTSGCIVKVVCNNLTGINSPLFQSRDDFDLNSYDCLLYHYYVGDSFLETLLSSPIRKAVFYHGITTPPEVYAPYSPDFVDTCVEGLRHLHQLHQFDAVFAASDYNIGQIQSASPTGKCDFPFRVFPPIVTFGRFFSELRCPPAVPTHLLTVGRIFSSKNIEGVIQFAEALAKHTNIPTRLTIAGAKCEPVYVQKMLTDMTNNPLLEIEICLRISDDRLRELYSQADIFVSFSHHEGFCIPLVEAIAAGLPVVTHAMTAIEQTMGGSGIIVGPYEYQNAADQTWARWSRKGEITSLIAYQRSVFERLYKGSTIAGKLITSIQELVASEGLCQ